LSDHIATRGITWDTRTTSICAYAIIVAATAHA
jgi:hypothetical protein